MHKVLVFHQVCCCNRKEGWRGVGGRMLLIILNVYKKIVFVVARGQVYILGVFLNTIKYSTHKYILVKNIILWLILNNSKLNIKMVCVFEELFRLEGFCYIGFLQAASLNYLYLVEGLESLKTD